MILAWVDPARADDAVTWWAPDPDAAAEVRSALGELWPDAPVEVRVGTGDGEGIWYADGYLHVRTPDVDREGSAPADVGVEVALARSWLRRLPLREVRVTLVPEPPVGVVTPPEPWTSALALVAGPGLGVLQGGPPVHLAADLDGAWRSVTVGGAVTADLAALLVNDDGTPVGQTRLGAGAAVGLRVPLWGGDYVNTVGLAARWRYTARHQAPDVHAGEAVIGAEERMRWWGRVAPRWSLGVGLSLALDDVPHAFDPPRSALPDGTEVRYPPVLAALELGCAYHLGRSP